MEFRQIKELISLVNSTEIAELEIEDEGFRMRIRKEHTQAISQPVQVVETVTAPTTPKEVPWSGESGLVEVLAPMVGTFYRAPAPDAAPYVQVGDTVLSGQVLFIIEAMKMMNEIESELKGVVKQILVENGEPVEYGQPLLLVDPKA